MQDLKNNAGQTGGNKGNGGQNGSHAFDHAMRKRLAEAEVEPPMDVMDKVFGALREDGKTTIEGNQKEPIQGKSKGTPLKSIRHFSKRLSYVAAAAGILVVLTLGIKALSHKDSIVGPPAGLTALQSNPATPPATPAENRPEGQPKSQAEQPAEKQRERMTASAAQRETADTKPGAEPGANTIAKAGKEQQVKKSPDNAPASMTKSNGQQYASNNATGKKNSMAGGGVIQSSAVQNSGVETADQTPHQPVYKEHRTALAKPQVQQNTDPQSGTVSTQQGKTGNVLMAEPGQNKAAANQTAVAAAENDLTDKAGSSTALAQLPAGTGQYGNLVQVDRQDHSRGENSTAMKPRDRRERKGLFNGLIKKLGKSARAITEDLVTQDEDKTVINVGVLAITAYK